MTVCLCAYHIPRLQFITYRVQQGSGIATKSCTAGLVLESFDVRLVASNVRLNLSQVCAADLSKADYLPKPKKANIGHLHS